MAATAAHSAATAATATHTKGAAFATLQQHRANHGNGDKQMHDQYDRKHFIFRSNKKAIPMKVALQ